MTCGGRDFWIPASFSKIIAENIPQSVYIDMPHCGHIAVREDPVGCTEMINNFINSKVG